MFQGANHLWDHSTYITRTGGTVTFSPHLWRQGEKDHVCLLRQLNDVDGHLQTARTSMCRRLGWGCKKLPKHASPLENINY